MSKAHTHNTQHNTGLIYTLMQHLAYPETIEYWATVSYYSSPTQASANCKMLPFMVSKLAVNCVKLASRDEVRELILSAKLALDDEELE